jgi:hypothetical protein
MAMLLPIKIPTCSDDLLLATKLAGAVLEYAARNRSKRFNKQDFCARINPQGQWLIKKQAVAGLIEGLFKLTQAERKRLWRAFENDIDFWNQLDNNNYRFLFPALPQKILKPGTDLLVSFYEKILGEGGFTGLSGQKTDKLDRSAVEKCYREANKRALLCPACLRALWGYSQRKSLVDRDHFLPKSIYAPLAVHPYNLTLICIDCNSRIKSDKDPLSPTLQHRRRRIRKHYKGISLLESFWPYSRPGLDELELQFDLQHDTTIVKVVGKSSSPYASIRASRFDYVFELSNRWSGFIKSYLHDQVLEVVAEEANGKVPTREQVAQALEKQVQRGISGKYRTENAFLQGEYAGWLLRNRLDQVVDECVQSAQEHDLM